MGLTLVPSRGYQAARNSTNRSHNRNRSASPEEAAVRLRKYRQKGQNCTHLTGPSTDVTGRRRGVRLALTPTGKLGRPVPIQSTHATVSDSTRDDATRTDPLDPTAPASHRFPGGVLSAKAKCEVSPEGSEPSTSKKSHGTSVLPFFVQFGRCRPEPSRRPQHRSTAAHATAQPQHG